MPWEICNGVLHSVDRVLKFSGKSGHCYLHTLQNTYQRFMHQRREGTFFERAALLSPRRVMFIDTADVVVHPLVQYESDPQTPLQLLRAELQRQAY